MGMQQPKWFEYIAVRERRLLGTKVPPDFVIAFGPTNIIKPHATAEKAERQIESIRNWLSIHMQHEDSELQAELAALRSENERLKAQMFCQCSEPYLGAQAIGSPVRCERCLKEVPQATQKGSE